MITITIQSEIMEQKITFKTDAQSIAYLKKVKKLHVSRGKYKSNPRPKRSDYGTYSHQRYVEALAKWKLETGASTMKVLIETN